MQGNQCARWRDPRRGGFAGEQLELELDEPEQDGSADDDELGEGDDEPGRD